MKNFTFYSPTFFAFGKDRENETGAYVKRFGGTKVLLHYGGGSVVRSGLLDRVKESLEKENIPYSQKISTLSNYKKADVNGYEAVYTTRKAEGQLETTYYVNSGKNSTYIITESCQDSSEYLEGLGHIMDAMVQTFAVK